MSNFCHPSSNLFQNMQESKENEREKALRDGPPDFKLGQEKLEPEEGELPARGHELFCFTRHIMTLSTDAEAGQFFSTDYRGVGLLLIDFFGATYEVEIYDKDKEMRPFLDVAQDVKDKLADDITLKELVDDVLEFVFCCDDHRAHYPCCTDDHERRPYVYDEHMEVDLELEKWDIDTVESSFIKKHRWIHKYFRYQTGKDMDFLQLNLQGYYPRTYERMIESIKKKYNRNNISTITTKHDNSSETESDLESLTDLLDTIASDGDKLDKKQIFIEGLAAAFNYTKEILEWPCCREFLTQFQ